MQGWMDEQPYTPWVLCAAGGKIKRVVHQPSGVANRVGTAAQKANKTAVLGPGKVHADKDEVRLRA